MNKIELALDLINFMDFRVYLTTDEEGNDSLALIDNQCANLGGIEEERFYGLTSIIDRMTIYEDDYVINTIDNALDEDNMNIEWENWEELYNHLIKLINNKSLNTDYYEGLALYLDIIVNAPLYKELDDFDELKKYIKEEI